MRGEVLQAAIAGGAGVILGKDGKRYSYISARVHKGEALDVGAQVDFIALGEEARDIYSVAPVPAVDMDPLPEEPRELSGSSKAEPLFKYFRRALTVNYFRFTGRARRAEYWGFVLYQVLTYFLLLMLDSLITGLVYGTTDPESIEFLPILSALFFLYCVIPGLAITVRRLHDRGLTGWAYLISFFPYIGWLVLIIWLCLDSRRAPSKHGLSPKYGSLAAADTFR